MSKTRKFFEMALLAAITVACLYPFSEKAFHIDDPLFIWTAKHIIAHPFDFFGFNVNWYGAEKPISEIMKNPPLASYYMALASLFTGWEEKGLHIAFIIPAVFVVIGSYLIALKFTQKPLLAGAITLSAPVFIVSSTTIMSDVLMLAFWCWAIVLWMKGLDEDKGFYFALSGILMALSGLTKYFGVSLIPLIFAYSLYSRKKALKWLPWLILPVIIFAVYQYSTSLMYGKGLLFDAAEYATDARSKEALGMFKKILSGLAFTGGCMIALAFYTPAIWGRKGLIALAILFAAFIGAAFWLEGPRFMEYEKAGWLLLAEFSFFCAAGLLLIWLALSVFYKERSPAALLLLLWVLGTFAFAAFFNWTMNGRSILPMAPAAGILISHAIEKKIAKKSVLAYAPVIPALALSLIVAYADFSLANSAKEAAERFGKRFSKDSTWFMGHWGFQYYMESKGMLIHGSKGRRASAGDALIVPLNNTNNMPGNNVEFQERIDYPVLGYASTLSPFTGAGFYAASLGPLPFVLLPSSTDEAYLIFRIKN